jgi:ribosome maturation factor RimP
MNRQEAIAKIEQIAGRVADSEGIEIVEVELKGSGRQQLLRIVIDKPAGVTHGDCEFITQQVGTILDVEDMFPGSYQLEVSSPGVERKLRTWREWERFVGKPAKIVLKQPLALAEDAKPHKHFEGVIASARDQTIAVELPGGQQITFPFDQVDRANLKFEW